MKKTWVIITATAFLYCFGGGAVADSNKDKSGQGRYGYEKKKGKEEYWDGNCKVERKWKKNGGYKEERKCKGPGHGKGHGRGHGNKHEQPTAVQIVVYLPPWFESTSGEPDYKAGWEPVPTQQAENQGIFTCNSSKVGNVLGGLIGGVLGNQIGGGSGKKVATIGGVIAGVIIGGEIGRRMDAQNQACIAQVLEFAPPGEAVTWEDPESHSKYIVQPGEFEKRGDSYCRSFTTEVQSSGQPQRTSNKACRRPDGVWVQAL